MVIGSGAGKPGKTFSADALNSLNESIGLFVGSRIVKHWGDTGGPGPTDLKVEVNVKVTVDGESVVVSDDEFPWYVIDGSTRHAN